MVQTANGQQPATQSVVHESTETVDREP